MSISSTFNAGTKIAVEAADSAYAWKRGVAPSAGGYNTSPHSPHLGKMWWEGGLWHSLVTDGLPSIQDNQATIFPKGHAGDRRMDQQPPVQGRVWSEGDMSAPAMSDFLGVLLYAAMGAASTDAVPQASAGSLLVNEPINSNPKSLVLNNQPSDGGKILRFELTGGVTAGTISISGIDSYGNGASELISFGSAASVFCYSRTAWSSIAASGIALSGTSVGVLTIQAFKYWQHTFTTNSSAPTLSFERQNNPTAGEASANKAFIHTGMVLKSLTLDSDPEAVDGVVLAKASFEGEPAGTSAVTNTPSPSPLRVWPSWAMRIRRDNGTQWDVVTKFTWTTNTGNRNYRAAAGAQGPQGSFFGAQDFTGDITILVNNELEYQKWKAASQLRLHALWTTPWKLGTSNIQLSASIPAYLENVQVADADGAWSLTGNYRVVRDDNFPMSFQLLNGCPGTSLGTGVR